MRRRVPLPAPARTARAVPARSDEDAPGWKDRCAASPADSIGWTHRADRAGKIYSGLMAKLFPKLPYRFAHAFQVRIDLQRLQVTADRIRRLPEMRVTMSHA